MNQSIVQTLFPGFTAGLQQLHDVLLGPAAVICYAGLLFRLYRAGASYNEIGGAIVRLGIVVIVISQVYVIGDLLTGLASAIVAKTGWNPDQNIWQDYQTALATKYNPSTTPGNTNPWQFLFNAGEATGIALWSTFVYGASMLASALMIITRVVQMILISLEMALSPLFLAAILLPSLITVATRWATFFVALCLWSVAFAISDLASKALIDLAVNSGNNNAVGAVGMSGGSIALWLLLAVWVLFSSIAAPWFITKSLVTTGSHGMNLMGPAIMGAILTGVSLAKGATGNISSGVSAAQALSSPPPQQKTHAVRPGFNP